MEDESEQAGSSKKGNLHTSILGNNAVQWILAISAVVFVLPIPRLIFGNLLNLSNLNSEQKISVSFGILLALVIFFLALYSILEVVAVQRKKRERPRFWPMLPAIISLPFVIYRLTALF